MPEQPDGAWNGTSFGTVAQLYEASRPDYPVMAAKWLLGGGSGAEADPLDVVDVGAGTGKLTEVLAGLGHRVTAVDPDAGMLAVLRAKLPGVTCHVGSAELIPLPDGSVDAVVIAQAFHWVDPVRAFPEIARVLRPGGTVGVVWNHRDVASAWMRELASLWGENAERMGASFDHVVPQHPLFGPVQTTSFGNMQSLDADELVGLTESRSYVISLAAFQRDDLLVRIRALAEAHAAATGLPRFPVAYRTRCHRLQKRYGSVAGEVGRFRTDPTGP